MSTITRRNLLKAGVVLGAASLLPAPFITRAHAAEQVLTLYNGQHRQVTDALIREFTTETGIEVVVRAGNSAQLASQLMEEGAASPCDIFYSEESPPIAAMAGKGLLVPLNADTLAQIPAHYAAKDGSWTGISARCRVVAYNKSLIKEDELPKSVMDFAHEDWMDGVAYVPTSGAFQEQIIAIRNLKGRAATLEWLKGIKEYGRIYNTNNAAMLAVEQGIIATALLNNYYWFSMEREIGAQNMKSALYYFGNGDPGALVTVSAAGILKSSKKQDDAQKFVHFMLSEKGQQAIVNAMAEYPLRAGVTSPYALKPISELGAPEVTPSDIGDAADAMALQREAGLA